MNKSSQQKTVKEKPLPLFLGKMPEHKVSLAFKCGGVEYFQFDEDIYFLPFRRGLHASMVFKELQCGVDREYLLWMSDEISKVLKPKDGEGMDITRIGILNANLKDRLKFIFEPDLIYKLAAVCFFDKDENPYNYSLEYGYKKIAKWKASEEVHDFFLRQPIKKLVPFFKQDEENIMNYLLTVEKIKKQHTANLS